MKSFKHFLEDLDLRSKTWSGAPAVRNQGKLIWVDVSKFDKAWAKDLTQKKDFYLPPNSRVNAIGDRKERFGEFLQSNSAIHASTVSVRNGIISFADGRHRYAYMRDSGAKKVPIFFLKTSDFEWIKKNLV